MSKKVSKIILICAIAIIIPIAIVATILLCSNDSSKPLLTISYVGSGTGTVEGNKEAGFEKGEEVTLTAKPSESSDFIKWLDKDNKEISKETVYTFKIESSMKISAQFDKKTYNVTYEYDNGTENSTGSLSFGDKLPVVTKEGYAFNGWKVMRGTELLMTLPAESTLANFTGITSGELKLVATWVKTATLKFDLGEGYTNPNIKERTIKNGEAYGELPTASYYVDDTQNVKKTIVSWKDANGNAVTKDTVANLTDSTNEVTLTAVWKDSFKTSYKVKGSDTVLKTEYLAIGDTLKVPENAKPEKGYTYEGTFTINDTAQTTLPEGTNTAVVVIIETKEIEYTVTYKDTEVQSLGFATKFTVSTAPILLNQNPTKEHYTFKRYLVNGKEATQIDMSLVNDSDFSAENNKFEVVADYDLVEYEVKFDLGYKNAESDATNIILTPKYTVESTSFEFPSAPIRVGFILTRWYYEKEVEVDGVKQKQKITVTAADFGNNPKELTGFKEFTVYAEWLADIKISVEIPDDITYKDDNFISFSGIYKFQSLESKIENFFIDFPELLTLIDPVGEYKDSLENIKEFAGWELIATDKNGHSVNLIKKLFDKNKTLDINELSPITIKQIFDANYTAEEGFDPHAGFSLKLVATFR